MTDLMNSPGHRANILDPKFTHVGIGSWSTPAGQTWNGGGSPLLNAWIAAPERAAMLAEARPLVEGEELLRLATSFPGWVRVDPATGKGPPNWKTALLVLLADRVPQNLR